MKTSYIFIIVCITSISTFAQESSVNFNVALKNNLKKYNIKSDLAFETKSNAEGAMLFDSLVAKHLIGTKFEDYNIKSLEKRKVNLSSFKKPVFLLTYASWCVPSKGEIPALNKLAVKYAKQAKIVMLFWDKKHEVKKIAKKFNHNITICYANESYQNDAQIISNLKHTLGFPTSYFLDENLKVVNIKRGGAHPRLDASYITAYTMNYDNFTAGLASIILEKNVSKSQLSKN